MVRFFLFAQNLIHFKNGIRIFFLALRALASRHSLQFELLPADCSSPLQIIENATANNIIQ